jgi:hypothetical protein
VATNWNLLLGTIQESLPHTRSKLHWPYAAFFPTFTLAHLARCAAAIFLRADADIV